MGNSQRKLIFQPLICRAYVSVREGGTSSTGWQNGYYAIMRCYEFFWFRSVNPAIGNWFGNNFSHGELVKPSQVTYEWLFLITYFLFTDQPGWIFLLAPGWLLSLGTERHLSMGHKMWFGRLGLTNHRALKWGSNKAFNDNVTLLLESCVDHQAMDQVNSTNSPQNPCDKGHWNRKTFPYIDHLICFMSSPQSSKQQLRSYIPFYVYRVFLSCFYTSPPDVINNITLN